MRRPHILKAVLDEQVYGAKNHRRFPALFFSIRQLQYATETDADACAMSDDEDAVDTAVVMKL